jgi:3-methyladenine DNA glycosylase AlkC
MPALKHHVDTARVHAPAEELTQAVAELIGRLAPADPETSLPLMARLTHRSSCEFAIRGCIEAHPQLTFGFPGSWVGHPDEHVRRLVSEGSRPRLPWGVRLRDLQHDPTPTIALLDRLRDDPSAYVRRSVANHLGDIVKDHPDLAAALRLATDGDAPVPVVVEYVIHYLGVRGHRKPKAYRLGERVVEPGVACDLRRRQRFAHASIRRVEPGEQLVEVQVNGRVLGSCSIELDA